MTVEDEELIPENLDSILEEKGYIKEALTSVQILKTSDYEIMNEPDVLCGKEISPKWLSAFSRLSKLSPGQSSTITKMFKNITGTPCCAVIRLNGSIQACGLGVLIGKTAGLFDIVVAEAERGKGYGRKLLNGILTWAVNQKAEEISSYTDEFDIIILG